MTQSGRIREPFHNCLVPGRTYRVKNTFLDAAKSVHRPGETFTYWSYLPNGFAEATYLYVTRGASTEEVLAIEWDFSPGSVFEKPSEFFEEVA